MGEKTVVSVVTEFINAHIGKEFTARDLRSKVALELGFSGAAPGSPDRVMRDLKQRKKINYKLLSRTKSLYLGLPVETQQ